MAYSLPLSANFIGLIFSIWMGVFVITHNQRSRVAWSSGLTLWSSAGFFANILLIMLASPAPVSQPLWLRLIFPFWPQEASSNIANRTLSWAAYLGILFWYQTSVFIVPGRLKTWRRWSLYLAYAVGALALVSQTYMPHLLSAERADPLLVDTQRFTFIYLLVAISIILFSGLSVLNLREAKRLSASIIVKHQINPLIAASLIVCLATLLSIIGAIPGLSIPVLWVSSILVLAIGFFGYGVIRYSALVEHRILRRDLAFSAVATGLVVVLYMSICLWLIATYELPVGIVVFVIPLVILSHSMIEQVRQVVERFIYDRKTRVLRTSLRDLSKLAGEQASLGEVLSRSLETICYPVRATYGVILLFDQDRAHPAGTCRWDESKIPLFRKDFEADDIKHLDPGSLPEPFLETTLLIPLNLSMEQIGALLLGRPENGIHYPKEDLLLLQDPTERITELIIRSRRINNVLELFANLPLQDDKPFADLIPVAWVEDAMQHIYDYAYLGDSPLINLTQVRATLDGTRPTHLDKGKIVNQVVTTAIEKLRPDSAMPTKTIPREWYPYLILHDAYFEGLPNREIMSKLYISEGTFHRTRRSAVRSVTRVLSEIETAQ